MINYKRIFSLLFIASLTAGCNTAPIKDSEKISIHKSGIVDVRPVEERGYRTPRDLGKGEYRLGDKDTPDKFQLLANKLRYKFKDDIELSKLKIRKFDLVISGAPYVQDQSGIAENNAAAGVVALIVLEAIQDTGERTVGGEVVAEYDGVPFSTYHKNSYRKNEVSAVVEKELEATVSNIVDKITLVLGKPHSLKKPKKVIPESENSVSIVFERESAFLGGDAQKIIFDNKPIAFIASGDKYNYKTTPGIHSFGMLGCTSSYEFENNNTYNIYLASYCFDIKVNGEQAWP